VLAEVAKYNLYIENIPINYLETNIKLLKSNYIDKK
jgi:hypothetical protein